MSQLRAPARSLWCCSGASRTLVRGVGAALALSVYLVQLRTWWHADAPTPSAMTEYRRGRRDRPSRHATVLHDTVQANEARADTTAPEQLTRFCQSTTTIKQSAEANNSQTLQSKSDCIQERCSEWLALYEQLDIVKHCTIPSVKVSRER